MAQESFMLRALHTLYYGWWIVITLAITETISYGVLLYAFGVFINPMQAELGWSRGELSLGFSLGTIIMALAGIPLGRWLDRRGARGMMTVGSLLCAVLVYAWSQVQTLPAFYLVWLLLGISKAMVLYEPAFWIISAWFARRRRRALALMTFVAGFSVLVFAPLTQWLVETCGWREALVLYAVLLAVTTFPMHALLLRRRPADIGLQLDGDTVTASQPHDNGIGTGLRARQALRLPAFWWMTAAFTFNGIALMTVMVHVVPYLQSLGYAASFASLIYGLIGLVSLPGRLIFPLLGSRLSPPLVTAALFTLHILGISALLGALNATMVWVFLLLFGLGYGAVSATRASLVAEFFGTAHYGTISSVQALFVTLLGALAPALVGAIYDQRGSYAPGLVILVASAALSVVCILLAARARKRIPLSTTFEATPSVIV
jgi:MFS family permease